MLWHWRLKLAPGIWSACHNMGAATSSFQPYPEPGHLRRTPVHHVRHAAEAENGPVGWARAAGPPPRACPAQRDDGDLFDLRAVELYGPARLAEVRTAHPAPVDGLAFAAHAAYPPGVDRFTFQCFPPPRPILWDDTLANDVPGTGTHPTPWNNGTKPAVGAALRYGGTTGASCRCTIVWCRGHS